MKNLLTGHNLTILYTINKQIIIGLFVCMSKSKGVLGSGMVQQYPAQSPHYAAMRGYLPLR